MRIFVTGGTGFVGSAVVEDLIAHGHRVLALARSDESAAALDKAGAEVRRGGLDDLDTLRAAADETDGVIQLAFTRDFAQLVEGARAERRAVDAIGAVLSGSGRPFVLASGGPTGNERDADFSSPNPRNGTPAAVIALAETGVRSAVVRLSPTTHDETRCMMIANLAGIARRQGFAAYVGDGSQHWPSAHRLDTAPLFRLALEKLAPEKPALEEAEPAAVFHAVGENVTTRAMADVIAAKLGIPARAVTREEATPAYGYLATLLAADMTAGNTTTRATLGWEPTHPTLLDDLAAATWWGDLA